MNIFLSPAGWDNEKKMAILQENMTNIKPDDFYNEIIQKPVITRKVSLVRNALAVVWFDFGLINLSFYN